jgi:uncharacterized protein YndB with AHSA1/START domain
MNDSKTAVPNALVLRRTFNAPRARVFAAWTNPELMRRFFSSDDSPVAVLALDVRTGGSYRLAFRQPSGEEWVVYGTYREVVPPERLSMTWRWAEDDPSLERETLLTLEFHDRAGATELVLTHVNFRDEQQRDSHKHGWTDMLDRLSGVL